MHVVSWDRDWLVADTATIQRLELYLEVTRGRWIHCPNAHNPKGEQYISLRIIAPGSRKTVYAGYCAAGHTVAAALDRSSAYGPRPAPLWPCALLHLLNTKEARTGTLSWLEFQP